MPPKARQLVKNRAEREPVPRSTVRLTRVMAAMREQHRLPPAVQDADTATAEHSADRSAEYRESIRLCFLIYDIARLHREAYDNFMRPLGITRSQWSMLAQLSRQDGVVQNALCELLDLRKAQVGVILTSLEKSGWVERRDDPLDKRVKRVYLVRPAHHIINQMSILAGQFGSRILQSLTESDRRVLGRMLAGIKHDLSDLRSSTTFVDADGE